jgi:hypothetical protein
MADVLVKEGAEGSQTLEPYLKTHIRYPDIFRTKQFLGFFNASFNQVLVGSFVKCLSEEP